MDFYDLAIADLSSNPSDEIVQAYIRTFESMTHYEGPGAGDCAQDLTRLQNVTKQIVEQTQILVDAYEQCLSQSHSAKILRRLEAITRLTAEAERAAHDRALAVASQIPLPDVGGPTSRPTSAKTVRFKTPAPTKTSRMPATTKKSATKKSATKQEPATKKSTTKQEPAIKQEPGIKQESEVKREPK